MATNLLIQYQALTEPVAPPSGETITLDKWYQPGVNPTRNKSFLTADQVPFVSGTTQVAPLDWQPQNTNPTRKPGLLAALQQAFVTDPTTPANEIVTLDKWYLQGAIPTRKPSYLAANQRAFINDLAPVVPEIVTLDKWFRPPSQPTQFKLSFNVSLQQFFWIDTVTPPPFVPPAPPTAPDQPSAGAGGRYRRTEPIRWPKKLIDDIEALYRLIYENPKALDAKTIREIAELVGFFAEAYDGRLPPPEAVAWRDLVEYPNIDLGVLSYAADLIIARGSQAEELQQPGEKLLPGWARDAIRQGGAVDRALERLKIDAKTAAARASDEDEEDAIMALLMVL